MKNVVVFFFLFFVLIIYGCESEKKSNFNSKEIYRTEDLIIHQISKNTFLHTSFKQTTDFGNVPCNGLIIRNGRELIIFDTPTNDSSSEKLMKWAKEMMQCNIKAIIPTHFHDDCLGGLAAFHKYNIPSYAHFKTIELASKNKLTVPINEFKDSLTLFMGNQKVIAKYFGEGHTKDNIIGYFPGEEILFGGCLIKELGASKGYLGDANIAEWSNTVLAISKAYPNVQIVIPGHGKYGNKQLLDYTIKMFAVQ